MFVKENPDKKNIGNNINFYLSTFPAKINDKIFQNKGKTLLLFHFQPYFVVFPKENFSSKIQLSTTAVVPQHFNVKDTEQIDCETKNYSITINMQKSLN